MSIVKTIDLTYSLGCDLRASIKDDNKYKLIVKSTPYNTNGAYWAFENCYIHTGDKLYDTLTHDTSTTLKDAYVTYYNNVKNDSEKKPQSMPEQISCKDVNYMCIYVLPANYSNYYL